LLLGFSFFFLQLSLVMGWGNYVHYATFMSARAYLSAGPSKADQKERATEVIVRTLKRGPAAPGTDRLPALAKGQGGAPAGLEVDEPENFSHDTRGYSWLEGVRYTFRSRLLLVPFAGSSANDAKGRSVNSVTLTSESWLGREPAEDECLSRMNGRFFDNGC
jgi:hypothetical protein